MKIAVHAGVHCTEQDRLLKGFQRNSALLSKRRVAVPDPGGYRNLLSDTLKRLGSGMPSSGARDILLDAILTQDPAHVDRCVISHENLFCVPKLILGGQVYYQYAEERLTGLRNIFRYDEVELFLSLRNPATMLPAVFSASPQDSFGAFTHGVDPLNLRWFQFIERLRAALPDMPITIWAYEDTPLLWGEVIRAVSGLESGTKIAGSFDILSEIMAPEGMRRFRAYLGEHPDLSEPQKRKVMTVFLGKYALDDQLEEVLDLPGWTEDFIEHLTDIYEADLDYISEIPGVRMILS